MPQHYIASVLATGLFSGSLFLVIVALGLGFIFMFLSILPLLMAGLSKTPRHALHGGVAASCLVAVAGSPALGFLFLLFLVLPAWHFCRMALLSRMQGAEAHWYPIGHIVTHFALFACTMIALVVFYYAGEQGGIATIMEQKIRSAFADMPEEYEQVVGTLASQWNFLIFSILAWMWAGALYLHAWIANRLLMRKHAARRVSVAVEVFPMQGGILYLLAVCALASLIGSESMQFLGKSCFIVLLMPYFFLGAALMHKASANWPNRRFFLFFIYFLIASQVWVALLVALVGCIYHLKSLNKGLSSGGSSST